VKETESQEAGERNQKVHSSDNMSMHIEMIDFYRATCIACNAV